MKTSDYRGPVGRDHAIDRLSKLEAVTVVRVAAPTEAEFAARRARLLTAQFRLGDHSSVSANIDFQPSALPVRADLATASGGALAAAAAYRDQSGERRRKSALRFVEWA